MLASSMSLLLKGSCFSVPIRSLTTLVHFDYDLAFLSTSRDSTYMTGRNTQLYKAVSSWLKSSNLPFLVSKVLISSRRLFKQSKRGSSLSNNLIKPSISRKCSLWSFSTCLLCNDGVVSKALDTTDGGRSVSIKSYLS